LSAREWPQERHDKLQLVTIENDLHMRNHQGGPSLIISLMILSLALGAALVFGQGGAGRAPQNGSGRANSNKSSSKPTTPARKPARTTRSTTPPFHPTNPQIELVRIPPGSFMMGSTNGNADEKPVHQVTINYSFYMGKYEVTQAQWQAVMGDNQSRFYACGGNCPVETVQWDDVQKFIQRLNGMNDGHTYRLPTEAEWEYACRAGTTGDYAGNLSEMAWYSEDPLKGKTHAVGGKQPNSWGLADMHGNVWEWCQDWYHETYYGAPTDGSAWLSGGQQKDRVLRGGSYFNLAADLRSASRSRNEPHNRLETIGFQVVAVARNQ
jgi:formylglycine-generating enzyme required for sulfatase activity